jgi:adenylylsulfate kinase
LLAGARPIPCLALRLRARLQHDDERRPGRCVLHELAQRWFRVTSAVVWVTGLPSSGKSTLAVALRHALVGQGTASLILDGDSVRQTLVPQPGYGDLERDHFYDTLARLASLLARQDLVVVVPATANRRAFRERARALAPHFIEVWLAVSTAECRRRDKKGLYALGEQGAISHLPGADAAYEPPESAEVIADGGSDENAVARIVTLLEAVKGQQT